MQVACGARPVNDVAQLNPGRFALAARDNIDLGPGRRFLGQGAGMRPAEDDGHVHDRFDRAGGLPGLLDLGRVGGDADDVRLEAR